MTDVSPLVPETNGSWATGGAAIDEWNPSSCPSTYCNNSAAAAAGYTLGKQAWPWSFTGTMNPHQSTLIPTKSRLLFFTNPYAGSTKPCHEALL